MNDEKFWSHVVDVGRALLDFIEEDKMGDLLITYGDLARRLPYEFSPRNLDTPLGRLSDVCKELGLPLISTIVIYQAERRPGAGYFKYFFPKTKSSDWDVVFIQEYMRVKSFSDWTPLADELGLD